MNPVTLWIVSNKLHRSGMKRCARGIKAINSLIYSNALPPEVTIDSSVRLWHHGLGVVIHPDTTIGRGVQIAHHVTIGAGSPRTGTTYGVVIQDGVKIAAGAVIAPPKNTQITIGKHSVIGANSVVLLSLIHI